MTRRQRELIFGIALLIAATAAPAAAQGQSQGRGRGNDKTQPAAAVSASVVFRDSDHATFRDYFATHKITAEPLPPGIAKNLARGKPLPPGIAKRAVPAELVAVGPKLDKDTTLAIVGDVVVATRSGVVIDILAGVFKR